LIDFSVGFKYLRNNPVFVKFIQRLKKWFGRKETPEPRPTPAPEFKWPKIKFPKPKVPWKKKWPKPAPAPAPKKKYKKLRQWILDYELWDNRPIRDQLEEKIKNWWSFDAIDQADFINAVEDTFA